MDEHIKKLIDRFNRGNLDESGLQELEKLIEEGVVDIRVLTSLHQFNQQLDAIQIPEPGEDLDQSFYAMLDKAKTNQVNNMLNRFISRIKNPVSGLTPLRLAYSVILILIGIGLGMLLNLNGDRKQIDELSSEIKQMQSMMMLTLLDESSATERLKAINLSSGLNEADDKVIGALLNTLNHDENANVRLAAIDALLKYADNEKVRSGMVASLSEQDLPIVQVTLADVMVLLKEKRAVDGLKKLRDAQDTDEAVKKKMDESIHKLI